MIGDPPESEQERRVRLYVETLADPWLAEDFARRAMAMIDGVTPDMVTTEYGPDGVCGSVPRAVLPPVRLRRRGETTTWS